MINSSIKLAMRKTTSSGFTLVELMVTLAVFAILVAIAAPNVTTTISANRVTDQVNNLLGVLNYARNEAITRNFPVQVVPGDSTVTSTTLTLGTQWISGMKVVAQDPTNNNYILLKDTPPMQSGFQATATTLINNATVVVTSVQFGGNGTTTNNNYIGFVICDKNITIGTSEHPGDIINVGRAGNIGARNLNKVGC
ncbi:MAG: GspH/FimT family pseudopilin [Gammaproteobacteria bacterium]|nr:GspH/FimT family pseudopilin [Gammaproteobacteria bacterium]